MEGYIVHTKNDWKIVITNDHHVFPEGYHVFTKVVWSEVPCICIEIAGRLMQEENAWLLKYPVLREHLSVWAPLFKLP